MAATYDPLFAAQISPAPDEAITAAFDTIRDLQLDGSDFVAQFSAYEVPTDLDSSAATTTVDEPYDSDDGGLI